MSNKYFTVNDKQAIEALHLPLVSILIPTYNQTDYIKFALESAINQTYTNIEILIGDDSTNDHIEKIVKPYMKKFSHIRYLRNNRTEYDYGISNGRNLIKKARGKYISFLAHDDLIVPDKIEYMVRYAILYPNVTLITSHRDTIDQKGNQITFGGAFQKICDQDIIIKGRNLIRRVLLDQRNYIGEASVALIAKKYIDRDDYYCIGGKKFSTLIDIATWFSVLEIGDAIFIARPLTLFRMHDQQNTHKIGIQVRGCIDWLNLLTVYKERGYFNNVQEYKKIACQYISYALGFVGSRSNELQEYKKELSELHSIISKELDGVFLN